MSFMSQHQLLATLTKAGLPSQLIRKADLQMADLISDGGYLVDEQAIQYIRSMIKQSMLLKLLATRNTSKPEYEITKIAYEGEVLRLGEDGRALTEAERVKPDFDKVTFTPVELVAETRFTRRQLEDNIEGNNLRQVIQEELTRAASRDLEKIVLQGDTTGTPGSMLTAFNGLIVQTTTNLVPAVNAPLDKNTLRAMFKVMEDEFLDKSVVKFFTSKDAEEDYRDSVAARQTVTGDGAFGANPSTAIPRIAFNGVEVVPLHLIPSNLGNDEDETVVLLFDPKNVFMVWRRDILIESDYDVPSKKWTICMSMRTTAKYREERAAAKATGILLAA